MSRYVQKAGGYDWVANWQEMYDREREQAERATEPEFTRYADFWQPRAQRFARASDKSSQPDTFMQVVQLDLQPIDTVLDVGAGTGRHSLFLARSVAQVIAVEPSEAMRTQMERRIVEEHIDNISVIGEKWPPARLPEAAIVLSVNVVYGVQLIAPFLQAMNAAARRACYLCLGIEHPTSVFAPLWRQFHGEERHPLPAALEALNVLHQLGYPAEMKIVESSNNLSYSSWDDALEDVRERLRFIPNHERDQAIREALKSYLVQKDNGSIVPQRRNPFAAVIHWTKQI